jgi:uncharacterized protein YfdQ (DUF2303 family)
MLDDGDTKTETEAAYEISSEPIVLPIEAGAQGVVAYPPGWQTLEFDREKFLAAPRRAKGRAQVHDAGSLIRYLRKHGGRAEPRKSSADTLAANAEAARPAIYADVDTVTIVGVINGHGAGPDAPGWGDHRAILTLRHAPEWTHWAGKDRQWLQQVDFAEHVEEGFGEIVEPAAADMLELAQTIQANNRVDWKSQRVLATGQRQFTYHETVNASAGQSGTLEIPQKLALGQAVFDGQTEGYRIEARLQFRLREGNLSVRYLLTRPHDVVRAAFGDVVAEVEQGVGLAAFLGIAPQ